MAQNASLEAVLSLARDIRASTFETNEDVKLLLETVEDLSTRLLKLEGQSFSKPTASSSSNPFQDLSFQGSDLSEVQEKELIASIVKINLHEYSEVLRAVLKDQCPLIFKLRYFFLSILFF